MGFIKSHFSLKELGQRQLLVLLLALFFGGLKDYIDWFASGEVVITRNLFDILFYTYIYITLVWNGNMLIGAAVMNLVGQEENIRKHLIISSVVAVCWPVINHILCTNILFPMLFNRPCDLDPRDNYMFLVLSVVVTLFINSIYVARDFFERWQHSMKEKEALKRIGITAEFETLKSQVNPHFLFNSLNTLTALIEEDGKRAVDFVQQLANVYRYVLQNRISETVSLQDELRFTQSFVYLNQTRFGQNLRVQVNLSKTILDSGFCLPTLSLQMLVENAIKHNIISREYPLTIEIFAEDAEYLTVRNNLQQKGEEQNSSKIGLSNIKSRYGYLTTLPVIVDNDQRFFTVRIPLLKPDPVSA